MVARKVSRHALLSRICFVTHAAEEDEEGFGAEEDEEAAAALREPTDLAGFELPGAGRRRGDNLDTVSSLAGTGAMPMQPQTHLV